MIAILQHVAKKEKFTLPDEVAINLAKDADGNVRKAVLMLEALKMQNLAFPLLPYSIVNKKSYQFNSIGYGRFNTAC